MYYLTCFIVMCVGIVDPEWFFSELAEFEIDSIGMD